MQPESSFYNDNIFLNECICYEGNNPRQINSFHMAILEQDPVELGGNLTGEYAGV